MPYFPPATAERVVASASDPSAPANGALWVNSRLKVQRDGATEIVPSIATPQTYTQTYSTANRTIGAYTPDAESGAYTGVTNLELGSVYATVADVNALRVAVENLRAFVEDAAQALNAVIDDLQSSGIAG